MQMHPNDMHKGNYRDDVVKLFMKIMKNSTAPDNPKDVYDYTESEVSLFYKMCNREVDFPIPPMLAGVELKEATPEQVNTILGYISIDEYDYIKNVLPRYNVLIDDASKSVTMIVDEKLVNERVSKILYGLYGMVMSRVDEFLEIGRQNLIEELIQLGRL